MPTYNFCNNDLTVRLTSQLKFCCALLFPRLCVCRRLSRQMVVGISIKSQNRGTVALFNFYFVDWRSETILCSTWKSFSSVPLFRFLIILWSLVSHTKTTLFCSFYFVGEERAFRSAVYLIYYSTKFGKDRFSLTFKWTSVQVLTIIWSRMQRRRICVMQFEVWRGNLKEVPYEYPYPEWLATSYFRWERVGAGCCSLRRPPPSPPPSTYIYQLPIIAGETGGELKSRNWAWHSVSGELNCPPRLATFTK